MSELTNEWKYKPKNDWKDKKYIPFGINDGCIQSINGEFGDMKQTQNQKPHTFDLQLWN